LLENPFRIEEWTYYVGNRLIAVAYVDALPRAPLGHVLDQC
jgi:hypothetical protein